ncbi:MAG TPA: lipocalin family protein [Candidatus Limnocylindrales bacterium]|nr:lipocalin family protein [Candidatus Limnocylindrales bacterium]
MSRAATGTAVVALALILAACSGPILANPALSPAVPPTPSPAPSRQPDPQPVTFPRDDGPHDRLTEWWYFTGHLADGDGHRFGFEAVVFRAERGGAPVTWASHVALTDEGAGRFLYGQRAALGPDVDRSPRGEEDTPVGFDFVMPAIDPASGAPIEGEPWRLAGRAGRHAVAAGLSPLEAAAAGGSFALDLQLVEERAVALHGEIGWLDFGPAGSSYYYSRTRLSTAGTLVLDGEVLSVTGTGWFDHQWGDFISVGGGGWDWFAVNLDDGTDLTISLVRGADGSYPLVYGTLVGSDGQSRHLEAGDFTVEADPARTWTSDRTGATYPAGWTIRVPSAGLTIDLEPTVAAQELDTRPTTGVVYWEGSQVVVATRDGRPLGGRAYVELTGYGPASP